MTFRDTALMRRDWRRRSARVVRHVSHYLFRGKKYSPYSADTSLSPLQLIAARAVDAFENCVTTTALTSRVPLC